MGPGRHCILGPVLEWRLEIHIIEIILGPEEVKDAMYRLNKVHL